LCGRLRESEKHLAELSPAQVGRPAAHGGE
jgi:hypothetical protein